MPAKKKSTQSTKKSKTTVKKTPLKKSVAKPMKTTAIKTPLKKSEIYTTLAEQTNLGKKDVAAVLEALEQLMHRHLRKGGAGEFTLPGLMKLTVKRKPATKKRNGVNPFTGEPTVFAAKPARNVVKVRPLKKLKNMV